ncbi:MULTISPECIES: hypothetical protein [Pseudomonas]|uniref:hypothetical protein n=1 Tax=Pseudomonas TaxID=286 RepID=UPI000CD4C5A2|nr:MULTISPECIES: hypothetical protein [Pseudomonas]RBH53611.1 hypothetical protein C3F00_026645 [Pseudomonas sp. MWU13-2860]
MKGSWYIEVETSVLSGTGEASVEKQVYVGFVLAGEGREKKLKKGMEPANHLLPLLKTCF